MVNFNTVKKANEVQALLPSFVENIDNSKESFKSVFDLLRADKKDSSSYVDNQRKNNSFNNNISNKTTNKTKVSTQKQDNSNKPYSSYNENYQAVDKKEYRDDTVSNKNVDKKEKINQKDNFNQNIGTKSHQNIQVEENGTILDKNNGAEKTISISDIINLLQTSNKNNDSLVSNEENILPLENNLEKNIPDDLKIKLQELLSNNQNISDSDIQNIIENISMLESLNAFNSDYKNISLEEISANILGAEKDSDTLEKAYTTLKEKVQEIVKKEIGKDLSKQLNNIDANNINVDNISVDNIDVNNIDEVALNDDNNIPNKIIKLDEIISKESLSDDNINQLNIASTNIDKNAVSNNKVIDDENSNADNQQINTEKQININHQANTEQQINIGQQININQLANTEQQANNNYLNIENQKNILLQQNMLQDNNENLPIHQNIVYQDLVNNEIPNKEVVENVSQININTEQKTEIVPNNNTQVSQNLKDYSKEDTYNNVEEKANNNAVDNNEVVNIKNDGTKKQLEPNKIIESDKIVDNTKIEQVQKEFKTASMDMLENVKYESNAKAEAKANTVNLNETDKNLQNNLNRPTLTSQNMQEENFSYNQNDKGNNFNYLLKASNEAQVKQDAIQKEVQQAYNMKDARDIEKLVKTVQSSIDKGVSKLTVVLKPENLGKLQIQLTENGGKITAKFLADNENSHKIIMAQSDLLKNQLSEKGIVIDNMEFAYNDAMSKQQHNDANGRKTSKQLQKNKNNNNQENNLEVGTEVANSKTSGIYA